MTRDVHFGRVGAALPDWRDAALPDEADDDEALEQTPADVVGVLGFDPLEVEKHTPGGKEHDQQRHAGDGGTEVFHGTLASNIESIMTKGITLGQRRNFDAHEYEGERGQSVFVTTDRGEAQGWPAQSERYTGRPIAVFKIEIPAGHVLEEDEFRYDGTSKRYRGSIPPEWIKGYSTQDKASDRWSEFKVDKARAGETFYLTVAFPREVRKHTPGGHQHDQDRHAGAGGGEEEDFGVGREVAVEAQTVYRVVPDEVSGSEAFSAREGGGVYVFTRRQDAMDFQRAGGGKVLANTLRAHKQMRVGDVDIELIGVGDNKLGADAPAVFGNAGDSELYEAGTQLLVRDTSLFSGVVSRIGRRLRKVEPRSLYVKRRLVNADALREHFRGQGLKSTLAPGDMHVTVMFSRAIVDWSKIEAEGDALTVVGDAREVHQFPARTTPNGALVLRFESAALNRRHHQLRAAGASSDFPDYLPHVTLTYSVPDASGMAIEPYRGPLVFGPEEFKEVDEGWADDIKEEPL